MTCLFRKIKIKQLNSEIVCEHFLYRNKLYEKMFVTDFLIINEWNQLIVLFQFDSVIESDLGLILKH